MFQVGDLIKTKGNIFASNPNSPFPTYGYITEVSAAAGHYFVFWLNSNLKRDYIVHRNEIIKVS